MGRNSVSSSNLEKGWLDAIGDDPEKPDLLFIPLLDALGVVAFLKVERGLSVSRSRLGVIASAPTTDRGVQNTLSGRQNLPGVAGRCCCLRGVRRTAER